MKWVFLIVSLVFFAVGMASPANYAAISRKAALRAGERDAVRWAYQGRMP